MQACIKDKFSAHNQVRLDAEHGLFASLAALGFPDVQADAHIAELSDLTKLFLLNQHANFGNGLELIPPSSPLWHDLVDLRNQKMLDTFNAIRTHSLIHAKKARSWWNPFRQSKTPETASEPRARLDYILACHRVNCVGVAGSLKELGFNEVRSRNRPTLEGVPLHQFIVSRLHRPFTSIPTPEQLQQRVEAHHQTFLKMLHTTLAECQAQAGDHLPQLLTTSLKDHVDSQRQLRPQETDPHLITSTPNPLQTEGPRIYKPTKC
eukprot:NODE_2945_length_1059_cov_12.197425_g2811_i0.p1 GENE.NODE_2945_length_1059_cov_12.197425_g2811_i0~~NODE_2945_length_1059_cov_12.197425_g2811_i0.p1  ORF type:complete len:264 (+),score=41.84 NODE_2945_length_1059_cov_12.197425_g2811_i0:169-960(+)